MDKTITYSPGVQGWTSFYSYLPERMIGMNNRFYSFNGGNLWIHNSENVGRNNFYDTQYSSSITGVINENPHDVKTFKTFVLESTSPWDSSFETDLGTGFVDASWYSLKEGDYFAHIRRVDNQTDLDFRSALGIGELQGVDSTTPSAVVLTFSSNVGSIFAIGDNMYRNNGGVVQFVGSITGIDNNTITVDTTAVVNGDTGTIPVVGNFMFVLKNSVAESYGATGYYMKYTLTNDSVGFVELFAIGSNLFKSYP